MPRLSPLWVLVIALAPGVGWAGEAPGMGPYSVIKTAKIGGEGGFDYVYADVAGRRLYIPRRGVPAAVTIYDLDTLAPAGTISDVNAHGVAVDAGSGHGFASSKPIAMWDAKTLAPIKTIDVQGNPDGILGDPAEQRIYVFSHAAPNATVIDASSGTVIGTIDLGGAPEQAVADGKGHVYVVIEDKAMVAVVDAKTLAVAARYDLAGAGGGCAGLAFDGKNRILFAACRDPQKMVVLSADDGKIIAALPIGQGTDGAVFNPETMEAFSAQADGTLTVIKENSPTDFAVEQTVPTKPSAKVLTLDGKTGHILSIAADFTPPPTPAGARAGRGRMVPDSFAILVVGR
jgi:YVTN family beta-propeller protein